MNPLELSPRGTAAPRPRRILKHALMETRLVLRNGEQLLLALVIPLALIAAHVFFGQRMGIAREPFIASVIAQLISGTVDAIITTGIAQLFASLGS